MKEINQLNFTSSYSCFGRIYTEYDYDRSIYIEYDPEENDYMFCGDYSIEVLFNKSFFRL